MFNIRYMHRSFLSFSSRLQRLSAEGTLRAKASVRITSYLLHIPFVVPCCEILLFYLLDRRISRRCTSVDYTQVLSIYRRNTLVLQLYCLLCQSALPSSLLLYHNTSSVRRPWLPWWQTSIRYTHNVNWNAKYHGRFYASLVVKSDYYVLWDDDIGPARFWNERSLVYASANHSIVTANGRKLIPDSLHAILGKCNPSHYPPYEDSLGDGFPVMSDTTVDYGGHSWAFSRQTLIDMASMDPPSLSNSEDFHLSAAAFLRSGTNTVVLSQDFGNTDHYPDLFVNYYSVDSCASHMVAPREFLLERALIIADWIDSRGYVPVASRG